jgi:peptide/nickel transport system permease protein
MGLFKSQGEYLAPLPPGCYKSGTCYILGTDFIGRDVFSQLVWGSQLALMIGFLAAFFSVALSLVVGIVSGYFGGWTDTLLMRFTDVILVLPGLPLLIVFAAVLGASIFNLVIMLSILGWAGGARVIRAMTLSLKERPFVDAARIAGASHIRIMFKHIAPNVLPIVFLFLTFSVSGTIIAEASLSFIGLGDPTHMSWGMMLYYAQNTGSALKAWWWLLPPGMAITFISLGFFLIGRAFEQIINPRLRRR